MHVHLIRSSRASHLLVTCISFARNVHLIRSSRASHLLVTCISFARHVHLIRSSRASHMLVTCISFGRRDVLAVTSLVPHFAFSDSSFMTSLIICFLFPFLGATRRVCDPDFSELHLKCKAEAKFKNVHRIWRYVLKGILGNVTFCGARIQLSPGTRGKIPRLRNLF